MELDETMETTNPEFDKDHTLIVTPDGVYKAVPWEDYNNLEEDEAYIKGDYFYLYRGKLRKDSILPGVYEDEKGMPVIFEPTTAKEKEEFLVSRHLADVSPQNIINVLKVNKNLICSFPETSKLFIPDITKNDDILKRLLKMAFKAKNIDIDSCKSHFIDKNALFNFKQVIKGDSRLSILLFERGCDALNLKYTIILEEIDPDNAIGTSLNDPEAITNIIKNSNSNLDPTVDAMPTELPAMFKDNFRKDKLDLNGKIVVSSSDTYDLSAT